MYQATYLIDWRCEDCRAAGTRMAPMELTSEEKRVVLYEGGPLPKKIAELYEAEVVEAEVDHAAATGCRGRVRGEGGGISVAPRH